MTLRKRRPGLVYPTHEDWHYVGDTGEPDWYDPGSGEAWENAGVDRNLAFRVRESGIVDIHGYIAATSDPPSAAEIFLLPVGYRPSANTYYASAGLTTASKYVPMVLVIGSSGYVSVLDAATDPFPGASDAVQSIVIGIQMFLTPASAP